MSRSPALPEDDNAGDEEPVFELTAEEEPDPNEALSEIARGDVASEGAGERVIFKIWPVTLARARDEELRFRYRGSPAFGAEPVDRRRPVFTAR
jgi:hypothetical protein